MPEEAFARLEEPLLEAREGPVRREFLDEARSS